MRDKPFTLQLIVVGGFLVFIFIFSALAKSMYQDYRLEQDISDFEAAVNELELLASQKPKDVSYFRSDEFKDRYAKENLNLINPGERLIIIPEEDINARTEVVADRFSMDRVLQLPNSSQWWEYFFGQTLSLRVPEEKKHELLQEVPLEEGEVTEG